MIKNENGHYYDDCDGRHLSLRDACVDDLTNMYDVALGLMKDESLTMEGRLDVMLQHFGCGGPSPHEGVWPLIACTLLGLLGFTCGSSSRDTLSLKIINSVIEFVLSEDLDLYKEGESE